VEREHALVPDDGQVGVLGQEGGQPAGPELDLQGGQKDTVHVRRPPLCDSLVKSLTLLVEPPEVSLVAGERALAASHAGPRVVGRDLKPNREGAQVEEAPDLLGRDRPAAKSDHRRFVCAEHLRGQLRLEDAKLRFASFLEDPRDRPVPALELLVQVDEGPLRQACDLAAHGRLPGAHEADEGEVAA
jgi:hypothetical protein